MTEETIVPIETQRRHDGFDLRQIRRFGNIAIYEQSKGGSVHAYEVVRIRVEPGRMKFGKFYPRHEVYPKSELWGADGFTLLTLDEALQKVQKLLAVHSPDDSDAAVDTK